MFNRTGQKNGKPLVRDFCRACSRKAVRNIRVNCVSSFRQTFRPDTRGRIPFRLDL